MEDLKIKVYELYDTEGDDIVEAIFIPNSTDTNSGISLTGSLFEVSSWVDDNKPCEIDFHAKCYIRWDACTHWWFSGEGDDESSYCHLCGISSYISFMRRMLFTLQIAIEKIGEPDFCDDELKIYKDLKKSSALMDGYNIREVEYTEDNTEYDLFEKVKEHYNRKW